MYVFGVPEPGERPEPGQSRLRMSCFVSGEDDGFNVQTMVAASRIAESGSTAHYGTCLVPMLVVWGCHRRVLRPESKWIMNRSSNT